MGKRFLFLVAVSLLCGSVWGQVIDIVPRGFTAIELRGNVKCIVSTCDSSPSSITLHGIGAKDIDWRVKRGTLYVSVPSGMLDKKGYAIVRVNEPMVAKIKVGGAEVESKGVITGSSLVIETLGSVNRVLLDVDITTLKVLCAGDSDIAILGRTQSSNLSASLGSRIDCLGCSADSVVADCHGTSEIYVRADKYISAKAILGGSIYFAGDASLAPKTTLWGGVNRIEYSDAMSSFKLFAADTTAPAPIESVEPQPTKVEPVKSEPTKVEQAKVAEPKPTATPTTKPQPAKKSKKARKGEQPTPVEQTPATDEDFF